MRVLVIGGGGREHALAWKLFASPTTDALLCAPGNAGTHFLGQNLDLDLRNLAQIVAEAKRQQVDVTVVGPEAPLAAGIVDEFEAAGLKVFGPTRAAARIEASKAWAKELLRKHGIPTARAEVMESATAARSAIQRFGYPAVIKANGLAGGKGVWVAASLEEAEAALTALFEERALGEAGDVVVVEEHLRGRELSVLAFTDGEQLAVMPPARDYKRLSDGDAGPNTGGMGGYTRPSDATPELLARIEREILRPTLRAMAAEGHPFRGVLYAGLMLTAEGPKVLEFNCRLGDPEAQLILPLLESDLLEVCLAVAEGRLDPALVRWGGGVTCGVVLAAEGYPETPKTGVAIEGLEDLAPGVLAFHGGTTRRDTAGLFGGRQTLIATGGRVVTVVATGPTLAAARELVYENVRAVDFEGVHYRGDIGQEEDSGARMAGAEVPLVGDDQAGLGAVAGALGRPPGAGAAIDTWPTGDSGQPGAPLRLLACDEREHAALAEAIGLLRSLGIEWHAETFSVYRAPAEAERRLRELAADGARLLLAVAASEPAMPGLAAAWSGLPVIAFVSPAGEGRVAEDALRAATTVPDGAPVAVVGLDARGSRTAAWLAAAILSQLDARLADRYRAARTARP